MACDGKQSKNRLTVSAGLNGSFNVTDTLDCYPILVVPINELVFQLANFIY